MGLLRTFFLHGAGWLRLCLRSDEALDPQRLDSILLASGLGIRVSVVADDLLGRPYDRPTLVGLFTPI